ncbi:hypothetical protein BIWAKO_01855 [Bosea sp. BIWAKO-01]|nr:hypothetical protein BIWAKO_01855 [Bosea sp. BIWAKO-01]
MPHFNIKRCAIGGGSWWTACRSCCLDKENDAHSTACAGG